VTATRTPSGAPPERAAGGTPARSSGRRIRGLEPEERRQERRRQLIESALELFATQGYAHTPIEQICQNAYVGFKGFYDEFATKEALFLALYDDLLHKVSTAVVDAVDELRRSGSTTLRPLLDAFVHQVLDDRRVAQILFVEAAGLSPAVEAHRRQAFRRFAAFLEGTYVSGGLSHAAEPVAAMNTRRVALGVIGGIVEVMVDWLGHADPDADDFERLIDDLAGFCRVVVAGLNGPV
jgi:AcrR family transcriptional regulator